MGKTDFDNLVKVLRGLNTLNAGTIVSLELDFELPRGFIAKIHGYELGLDSMHEDSEGITADQNLGVDMCIVRDPDDTATLTIPTNEVQHDVIDDLRPSFIAAALTNVYAAAQWINALKQVRLRKDLDLITARNMRFNCIGVGSELASLTETHAYTNIYYTLEEVTDADILNLLDIL